jgi:glycine/D-amino acid oxidase-like deaminating enzyme
VSGLRVVVMGAGVMGATAARSLAARGHRVTLCDPGPLPHPLAASTDISKVVRVEYGDDPYYMALGERSLDGWHRWNRELGDALFHETGVLFVRPTAMAPGTFEHDSHATLIARGHRPERLDAAGLTARFPAWRTGRYVDGFFHARGGFVESGRVVEALTRRAAAEGVTLRAGVTFAAVTDQGVTTTDGEALAADRVVLALGAWTPFALPQLTPSLRATGHPVFHLRPKEPGRFVGRRFPVFGAAIADTGWYGFPLHPRAGVVKVARHGVGRALHPESPARAVTDDDYRALRSFLADTFPDLVDAEIASTRVCLYCDSDDGHFWIDRDPARPHVTVAAGDSGHGFKFAPVLGDMIADVVEGATAEERFRWRVGASAGRYEEAARCVSDR